MLTVIGIVGIACNNHVMRDICIFSGVVAFPYVGYTRVYLKHMLTDAEEDYIEFTKGAAWNPQNK